MNPFQVISNKQRPDDINGPEYVAWSRDVIAFLQPIADDLPEPFSGLVVDLKDDDQSQEASQMEAQQVSEWVFKEDSSFMDKLPPYTQVMNTPKGTQIMPDYEAVRESPEVHIVKDVSKPLRELPLNITWAMKPTYGDTDDDHHLWFRSGSKWEKIW